MKHKTASKRFLDALKIAPMTRKDAIKITGSDLTIRRMLKAGAIEGYDDINPHSEVKGSHSFARWYRIGKHGYYCQSGKKITEKGIRSRIEFLERIGYIVIKPEEDSI